MEELMDEIERDGGEDKNDDDVVGVATFLIIPAHLPYPALGFCELRSPTHYSSIARRARALRPD
eukprot:8507314-Pyramimonas_sp.AAC.2